MQHARESGVTIGFDCRTTTGRLPSPTGPITPLWALFNRFNANSPSLLSFFLSFFLSFSLSRVSLLLLLLLFFSLSFSSFFLEFFRVCRVLWLGRRRPPSAPQPITSPFHNSIKFQELLLLLLLLCNDVSIEVSLSLSLFLSFLEEEEEEEEGCYCFWSENEMERGNLRPLAPSSFWLGETPMSSESCPCRCYCYGRYTPVSPTCDIISISSHHHPRHYSPGTNRN